MLWHRLDARNDMTILAPALSQAPPTGAFYGERHGDNARGAVLRESKVRQTVYHYHLLHKRYYFLRFGIVGMTITPDFQFSLQY